ncbi:MAG: hypothetical protein ACJAZ3_000493 [Sphingobacteriales bacterium]|jgi:uncharacterized protein (TIGR01777 family)
MKRVLITGGTGLIGTAIIKTLVKNEYKVNLLSRSEGSYLGCKKYKWNPKEGTIDLKAFENIDYIVHLAGESIANGRLNEKHKKAVLQSRLNSTALLKSALTKTKTPIKKIICASAVGFYGDRPMEILTEGSLPGDDFISKTTYLWEKETKSLKETGTEVYRIRIANVLSSEGGFLPKLLLPFKLGIGSSLGSGKQYFPWIHIQDVVNAIQFIMEKNSSHYVFNLCSPQQINNEYFSKTLARVLKRPFWVPNVPKFALKLILGDLSKAVLASQQIEPKNLLEEGFKYEFKNLEKALKNILTHAD